MATCNSNTTQCLLQNILAELQDTNNAFNWDPFTFYFTLGIGAIALWFALLPLLQGLFFPSEKLKYDAAAIGLWSKKKFKVWDWGNMRYAVTTQTPFLDLRELSAWETIDEHVRPEHQPVNDTRDLSRWRIVMKKGPEAQLESGGDVEMEENSPQVSTSVSRLSAPSQHTSAGWLLLLRTLQMEDVFFQNSRLRPALATVIPSDISAAVAYGSIETLVILAIVAGCKQIAIKEGYPVCTAAGIQLDFRSHPSLGQIAAFSKYGMESSQRNISLRDLQEAYKHSQGILQYRGEDIENHFFTKMVRGRLPSNVPQRIREDLGSSMHMRDSVGGAWLLIGDIPLVPRVFPCAYLQTHMIASAYAVQHAFFTDVSDNSAAAIEIPLDKYLGMLPGAGYSYIDDRLFEHDCPPCLMSLNKGYSGSWLDPTPNGIRPPWPESLGVRLKAYLHNSRSKIVDDTAIVFKQALSICIEWLREPAFFRLLIAGKHERHRHILSLQLREVDYWLHKWTERDKYLQSVTTRLATRLFNRASGLAKITQNFEQFSSGSQEEQADTSGPGNKHIQHMRVFFARVSRSDWIDHNESPPAFGQVGIVVIKELGINGEAMDYAFQRFRQRKNKNQQSAEAEVDQQTPVRKGLIFRREDYKYGASFEEKWAERLTFFLIYRVVLYGALLETAVDNSCMLDIEMPQQIVPVL